MILIGAIALVGAFLITYERGAELLNFGAFIAFMGVNAASFVRYFVRANEKKIGNLLVPVLGFSDLRIHLVEPESAGKDCRSHLAGAGNCLWGVEDFVVPQRNVV